MKNILALAVLALGLTACNNSGTSKTKENSEKQEAVIDSSASQPKTEPAISTPVPAAEPAKEKTANSNTAFSTKEIISGYLTLKNALTKDDSKAAASAGKTLFEAFNKIDANMLDAKKKAIYLDIAESAKENAEHIGDNSGKIDHQREHFALLSQDINDLIKAFGSNGQKLYQDFCPMYNDGKGADWISESKEIKNPYQGTKMSTCGSVKKEL